VPVEIPSTGAFSLVDGSKEGSFLLNRNAALTDIDFDARALLPFLVELIAEDRADDGQRADEDIKNVAIQLHAGFSVREIDFSTSVRGRTSRRRTEAATRG
jgi:hypothetical protein